MDDIRRYGLRITQAAFLGLSLASVHATAVVIGSPESVVDAALGSAPIMDGHEDFAIHWAKADPPWSAPPALDFAKGMPGQVDIARLREGRVGASLVTLGSDLEPGQPGHLSRVLVSFDWFDALLRLHPQLRRAGTTAEIDAAARAGQLALVPALEGGDQIEGSLTALQALHQRGLRAMTLVYDHDNDLGEGANAFVQSARLRRPGRGLTDLGREAVAEMNRLGLIVDLSHAAGSTAAEVIAFSRAPVIFSHSNARALCDSPRNVSDEVLRLLAEKGGIIMLTPVPYLTTDAYWKWWDAGERHYAALKARARATGDERVLKDGMEEWDRANPQPQATLSQFADQVEYASRIVGEDHVGIGSDFDGMGAYRVEGLEDVSQLPALFAELARRGWSEAKLRKLSSENFLAVWRKIEEVAAPVH